MFNEQQERILDLYYIPVYVQSNLYTDDSFKVRLVSTSESKIVVSDQLFIITIFLMIQFNEVVKEVTDMLESLDSIYNI